MVVIQFEARLVTAPLPSDLPAITEGKLLSLSLPAGRSVQEILEEYELVFIQPVVALINEKTADLSTILNEGDQVRLLPQIAGG
jgi:molybdopterin converting factor small subunit